MRRKINEKKSLRWSITSKTGFFNKPLGRCVSKLSLSSVSPSAPTPSGTPVSKSLQNIHDCKQASLTRPGGLSHRPRYLVMVKHDIFYVYDFMNRVLFVSINYRASSLAVWKHLCAWHLCICSVRSSEFDWSSCLMILRIRWRENTEVDKRGR